jgi:hypothetical protein
MQLPPLGAIRALVQRTARLRARLREELGTRPLVLPNPDFFPDAFRPDQNGVRKLVRRMQKHAGMADIPVAVRLVQLENEDACGGSCASKGKDCCGGSSHALKVDPSFARLVDEGDTWLLQVPDVEVLNPVVLTTNAARALGHVFLRETQPEGRPIDEPVDVTAELAAVCLGFGVLLLEGSHIYQKSCGGPRIGKVTLLGAPELALATALFVQVGGHRARAARKEMSDDQRATFDAANAWAESNRELVDQLRDHPEALVDGKFEVAEAKSLLGRLFGGRKAPARDEVDLDELEQMLAVDPPKASRSQRQPDPEHDELRALVDQALDEA